MTASYRFESAMPNIDTRVWEADNKDFFAFIQSPSQLEALMRFMAQHRVKNIHTVFIRVATQERNFYREFFSTTWAQSKIVLVTRKKTSLPGPFPNLLRHENFSYLARFGSHLLRLGLDLAQFLRLVFAIGARMLHSRLRGSQPLLLVGNILEPRASILAGAVQFLGTIVALDDGTPTLKLIESRAAHERRGARPPFVTQKEHTASNRVRELTLFTLFNVPETPRTRAVRDLQLGPVKTKLDETMVWIVGGNFVGTGFLSLDQYLRLLTEVRRSFPSKQIAYFCHRGESRELTKAVAGHFDSSLKVHRYQSPLENWIHESHALAATIITFPSTTAFTLPLLVPKLCKIRVIEMAQLVDENHPEKAFMLRLERAIRDNHKTLRGLT